jgi:hypothetical protein
VFSHSHHRLEISLLSVLQAKMSARVDIPADTSAAAKGTAPLIAASTHVKGGYKKGLAIFDLVLRLGAVVTALAAAATMGTTDQTLPFFTQFFQFQASYDDLPTFQYVNLLFILISCQD